MQLARDHISIINLPNEGTDGHGDYWICPLSEQDR